MSKSKEAQSVDDLLKELAIECWKTGNRDRALSIDGNYGILFEPIKAKINRLIGEQRKDTYYITTGVEHENGKVVLGPFATQKLAMEVRALLEFKNSPKTYWVEELSNNLSKGDVNE